MGSPAAVVGLAGTRPCLSALICRTRVIDRGVTIEAEHWDASDPVETVPEEWLADSEVVPELQRLDRLVARAKARAARVIAMAHRRGLPQARDSALPRRG